jgi:hypothetical protein
VTDKRPIEEGWPRQRMIETCLRCPMSSAEQYVLKQTGAAEEQLAAYCSIYAGTLTYTITTKGSQNWKVAQ